jgi:hypothetical protein
MLCVIDISTLNKTYLIWFEQLSWSVTKNLHVYTPLKDFYSELS